MAQVEALGLDGNGDGNEHRAQERQQTEDERQHQLDQGSAHELILPTKAGAPWVRWFVALSLRERVAAAARPARGPSPRPECYCCPPLAEREGYIAPSSR